MLSCVWLFATPWTVAHQAALSMGFPSKNTGVGCYSLLQGIFQTQGLNPCLLHNRQILYHLSHQGSNFRQYTYQNWNTRLSYLPLWETCMQVNKQQLELNVEWQTASKLGKEYVKVVYCQPAYLTYIRVHHAKCQAGWSIG